MQLVFITETESVVLFIFVISKLGWCRIGLSATGYTQEQVEFGRFWHIQTKLNDPIKTTLIIDGRNFIP